MAHDYLTFRDSIDVIMERLDGRRYSFKEHGIGVRDFIVSSPYYATTLETIDGRDGRVDLGTELGYRNVKMSLYFVADLFENYAFKRDEIFRILDSRQPFYLTESRNPHKRWKVKIDGNFSPEQFRILGLFEVNCISASPYSESLGSTLNPSEHFQTRTSGPVEYTFTRSTFSVWNDGDAAIDPRQRALKIEYKGTSSNLVIRNLTNGTEWRYNGTTNANDAILLDGVKSLKNGVSVFGQTNRKLITLEPGWNDFELLGTSEPFEISFDFVFLYI